MPVIVVANPKGGVGKSTLSTQVAGYFASCGHAVMLGDVDQQQSARIWLDLRPATASFIRPWEIAGHKALRAPTGTTHVVLDTPAGFNGKRLENIIKLADKVLIPLQPSIFDIHATHDFLTELQALKLGKRIQLGVVGMRAKEGSFSADQLQTFLTSTNVPVLGFLRDTQNYVHLAARGLCLWDVTPTRVERDLDQWRPITKWLNA